MSVAQQFKCDLTGCEKVRTDTNHWWAVEVRDGQAINIYWWDYAAQSPAAIRQTKHFCGQAHALQHISAIMGSSNTQEEKGQQ